MDEILPAIFFKKNPTKQNPEQEYSLSVFYYKVCAGIRPRTNQHISIKVWAITIYSFSESSLECTSFWLLW